MWHQCSETWAGPEVHVEHTCPQQIYKVSRTMIWTAADSTYISLANALVNCRSKHDCVFRCWPEKVRAIKGWQLSHLPLSTAVSSKSISSLSYFSNGSSGNPPLTGTPSNGFDSLTKHFWTHVYVKCLRFTHPLLGHPVQRQAMNSLWRRHMLEYRLMHTY